MKSFWLNVDHESVWRPIKTRGGVWTAYRGVWSSPDHDTMKNSAIDLSPFLTKNHWEKNWAAQMCEKEDKTHLSLAPRGSGGVSLREAALNLNK